MLSKDDGPVVVGINRTQDGSLCVMQGSRVLCCIQKERFTRQKHHWGKLDDIRGVYKNGIPELSLPVDALVECFSSDRELDKLDAYERELAETLTLAPGCKRAHLAPSVAFVQRVSSVTV